METPNKYKSIPSTTIFNRPVVELNATQKAAINAIIVKFIQYLKAKHA